MEEDNVFTFSATSNAFGPQMDNGFSSGAVNRNGNLLAFKTFFSEPASLYTPPDFNLVHTFTGIDGGVAFDATLDTFYGVDTKADQIVAYSTETFAELFRLNIGEDISFGSGTLVASADGHWLALETSSGTRLFPLSGPTPTPTVPPTPTPTPTVISVPNLLIPSTTRRDLVFDFAGQNLYISNSTGIVQTFNLSTLTFGTSYNPGGSLNGLDIARDNSFVLVAQNTTGASQGTFHRVDLVTGLITDINYTRGSNETGAWDVAIASNGLALVTTQYGGSGWTPLRQINLATNAITIRSDAPGSGFGQVRGRTQIHRSADGTRLFFLEEGNVFTFSATSNIFGPSVSNSGVSAAVNRNGSLIAFEVFDSVSLNTAPNFSLLRSFNGIDGGGAFSASFDTFYGVNTTTNQIVAYSTQTFSELFRINIGENMPSGWTQFGTGPLVASADGRWLALETPSGIRLFHLIPAQLGNISTRLQVETGDNVLIGGFIVTGTQPKRVIVRAIGPSLAGVGVPGALDNPILELHDSSQTLASNDNWMDAPNRQEIIDSTLAPTNDLESAILMTLPANGASYTAIVRGSNGATGVGLVETYDLDATVDSRLANISTRGLVQIDDNVMIGGFIVVGGTPKRVIVRAIGPSLTTVPNRLANPTLELRNGNGALLQSNDDWMDAPNRQEISDSTLAPTDDLESAILMTLPAGNSGYTAIVRGVNGTTGVALVEVYSLQ